MSHNHILKRLVNETDAYKHQFWGRAAFDRWLLDKTFTEDLCETLLTETSPDLEFEKHVPGNARDGLPEYFAEALRKNGFPEYLHPYTAEDFKGMLLGKVKGLDAGFAIKPDGDIVAVHNNSGVRGIADKLMAKAIEMGGTQLDHFDGKLSSIYAKHFPKVRLTDRWNDQYAPEGWQYKPVEIGSSYFGTQSDHPKISEVNEDYPNGKPRIIYRTLADGNADTGMVHRAPEAAQESEPRRVTIGILP